MKIRILSAPPKFPPRVAELMVGCEIDLVHMMNPEGKDQSWSQGMCDLMNETGPESVVDQLAAEFGVERRERSEPAVPEHELYVPFVLDAIGVAHGADAKQEAQDILVRECGGFILMSQVTIPCSCVELLPDPEPQPA